MRKAFPIWALVAIGLEGYGVLAGRAATLSPTTKSEGNPEAPPPPARSTAPLEKAEHMVRPCGVVQGLMQGLISIVPPMPSVAMGQSRGLYVTGLFQSAWAFIHTHMGRHTTDNWGLQLPFFVSF